VKQSCAAFGFKNAVKSLIALCGSLQCLPHGCGKLTIKSAGDKTKTVVWQTIPLRKNSPKGFITLSVMEGGPRSPINRPTGIRQSVLASVTFIL